MERDFFGLNSEEMSISVKEEHKDAGKDTAFIGGSVLQWPFPSKVSVLPQFMTVKSSLEERRRKTVFDHFSSSGISTVDTFDSNQRPSQKGFNTMTSHFAVPVYHSQSPTDIHGFPGIRTFQIPSHPISVAVNNPFFKVQNSSTTSKQQTLGGIPVTSNSILPVIGSTTGVFTARNVTKSCAPPTQMTIFYGGTVHVFDDVSLEKAQSIMSMAAHGSSSSTAKAHIPVENQRNQSNLNSHGSGRASPISVTSHSVQQSGSGSSSNEDIVTAKTVTNHKSTNQLEVQKVPPTSSAPSLIPSVPQARKASLARFLEKRNERILNMAPYTIRNKPQECAIGWDKKSPRLPENPIGSEIKSLTTT